MGSSKGKTCSFPPEKKLVEEGTFLLAVTSFEATHSFFIADENNTFSITSPSHWFPPCSVGTVKRLNKLLQVRSQNDIELLVKEVREKGSF